MNLSENAVKLGTIFTMLAAVSAGQAQSAVTITADDMFNKVGQWYRAYSNTHGDDVVVAGRLGLAGGPQVWDFTNGPKDEIRRFDYLTASEGANAVAFPGAKLAEQMTFESDGTKSWLYFEQVPRLGRRVYGTFTEIKSPMDPTGAYKFPAIDFPETIRYQDAWETATSWTSVILTIDTGPDPNDPDDLGGSFDITANINYRSSSKVDAFGIINLPGIGFGEGLRVNSLVTFDIQADFGDGLQTVATEYARVYYWLMENRGIAIQISSKPETQPPPDEFAIAGNFVRMFETNHAVGERQPEGLTGLKVTLDQNRRDRILLTWDKLGTANAYRVEYTTNLLDKNSWKVLGNPITLNFTNNVMITSDPMRYYRVIGLP